MHNRTAWSTPCNEKLKTCVYTVGDQQSCQMLVCQFYHKLEHVTALAPAESVDQAVRQ